MHVACSEAHIVEVAVINCASSLWKGKIVGVDVDTYLVSTRSPGINVVS